MRRVRAPRPPSGTSSVLASDSTIPIATGSSSSWHDAERPEPLNEIGRRARLAELPLGARPRPARTEQLPDLRHRGLDLAGLEAHALHGGTVGAGSGAEVERRSVPCRIGEQLAARRLRLMDVGVLGELADHFASCTSSADRRMIAAAAAPTPGSARVPYPFIESPHFTPTPADAREDGRAIGVVVIHTMEIAETVGAAETCAQWFASTASEVSAHYCVDADSVVQCVREDDIALARPWRQRQLDRDRARGLRRAEDARLETTTTAAPSSSRRRG